MATFFVLLIWLVELILALVISVFLVYTLYVHYIHVKYSHIPGPGRKRSKEYGKLFVFYYLHHAAVHVYIPEVVREILVEKNYPKAPRSYKALEQQFGQLFMGKSLVTEINHEAWKPLGDLFSPTFHRNFLKTCIVQFNSSCDLLLEELSKRADGKTEINMLDMFNKVSLDCISKVAFGMDLNIFGEQRPQVIGDIKFVTESIVENFFKPFLWCNPLQSAVAYRQKVRLAASNVRKVARDCILAKLELLKRGEKLENNIMSHILQTSVGNSGLVTETDLENMVNHFVTFFSAGQETTACLMASTLLELGRHPEVAYKMKTEVDAVIGDDGYVSFEDLSRLKYTTAVLKESLRVHPPIADVLRKLNEDVVWNGVKISAGTTVAVCIINLARMEEHFESPHEFMPSRFLGDESYNYVNIPFSLGPRKCIGKQFAMIEAQIIMAKLMKYFTFDLVPGQSFHYIKLVTCKPKEGCLVYATPVGPNKPKGSATTATD